MPGFGMMSTINAHNLKGKKIYHTFNASSKILINQGLLSSHYVKGHLQP
jgi:hypothetical protein